MTQMTHITLLNPVGSNKWELVPRVQVFVVAGSTGGSRRMSCRAPSGHALGEASPRREFGESPDRAVPHANGSQGQTLVAPTEKEVGQPRRHRRMLQTPADCK